MNEETEPVSETIAGIVAGAALVMGFLALSALFKSCLDAWSGQ